MTEIKRCSLSGKKHCFSDRFEPGIKVWSLDQNPSCEILGMVRWCNSLSEQGPEGHNQELCFITVALE